MSLEEQLEKEIENHRCRGCECFHLVYSEPNLGLHWECELEATGEPCYMPGESYNPKWSQDCAELRRDKN